MERGGTICHIIRKTIARSPMPREEARKEAEQQRSSIPNRIADIKAARRRGEQSRGDEKRREGKRRGDV